MILDSSVVVAVLRREPEAETLLDTLGAAPALRISAANYLEAGIVLDRNQAPALIGQLDEFLADFSVEIVPVTAEHARIARDAHRRFGRWSGSPARLNFGDCFAYALAKASREPLLFKGEDFARTDILAA